MELPENFLQLQFMEELINNYRWVWPLSEVFHFFGLILLIGTVVVFDLRLLGIGRNFAIAPLKQFLPWGVLGFVLCVTTGLVFVTGLWANVQEHPVDVLQTNLYLQLKLLFIFLAGLNLLFFHFSGVSGALDKLEAGLEAAPVAKIIGATSLFLWVGVVYWGRLVPWGL